VYREAIQPKNIVGVVERSDFVVCMVILVTLTAVINPSDTLSQILDVEVELPGDLIRSIEEQTGCGLLTTVLTLRLL